MERYQEQKARVDMGYPIFRSPRKVDPSGDAVARQIAKTLGDYEILKSYLGPDLLGVRRDFFFNQEKSCDYSRPKWSGSKPSPEGMGNYPGQPDKHFRGVSRYGLQRIHVTGKPLISSNPPHTQSRGSRNLPAKVPASDHLTKAIPPTSTNASEATKNPPVKPTGCRTSSILREDLYLSEESEDEEGLPMESSIKVLKNDLEISKYSEDKAAKSHFIDKKKSDALSRVFNAKRRFKDGKGGDKEDKKPNDKAEIRIMVADKLYEKTSSSVDNFVPSDPVVLISIPDSEMTRFETEGKLPQTSDDMDQIMTDTGDRIDIGKILCPRENIEFQNPYFAFPDKVKLQTQSYYEQKNKENVEHKKRDKSSDKQGSKTQLKKRERANSPASVLSSVGSKPGCSGANKKIVHLKDKDDRQIKRKKTEENRSFSENSSADAPINSSSNAGAMRQHYSYLEKSTQRSDYGERCQNQYIDNAKRLKYMADRENDTITQWGLYLKAVLYFLLTGNAMEHESATKEAAFTMYKNTLSLIRFISSQLKNRANQSPDHYKLAVLSYRCEALLYYKLYQMKISEIEKHQKLITQNPVRLSGNSTDLETRVRSNSAHVPDPNVPMPLSAYNAITEQNQNLAYLEAYQDLWNLADSLVANCNHADFFNQLDLTCKPLTNFTSLIDLVKYVQEGVSRLLYIKS